MKKLIFMLIAALSVTLTSCSWFDSEPINPKVIGIGYIVQDRGVSYVEIDSVRYVVSKIYTGEKKSGSINYNTINPVRGILVTVADFQNPYTHLDNYGITFMLGEWDEAEIEAAFHENYTVFIIVGIIMLLFFGIVLIPDGNDQTQKIPITHT